ncbi:somatostatin receptor type 1 [Hyalella azteca]|uniref:Somatostatin receptor type 1 n=1 Tax=Hyalella azteca TaxID=294128 RepID=A0A8B7NZA8_HYAAZ|nr:somatostatin receptor type 1 [Hyalella azteca]
MARVAGVMSNSPLNRLLSQVSHLLCYANSAVNPIIYNFMSDKFRREFHRVLSCSGSAACAVEPATCLHYRTATSRLTWRTHKL